MHSIAARYTMIYHDNHIDRTRQGIVDKQHLRSIDFKLEAYTFTRLLPLLLLDCIIIDAIFGLQLICNYLIMFISISFQFNFILSPNHQQPDQKMHFILFSNFCFLHFHDWIEFCMRHSVTTICLWASINNRIRLFLIILSKFTRQTSDCLILIHI